jgi:2-keto-4-pentenoate hydratase/2-oxohepta-3-ene-1,7-dioic acid hydratase in catechol pathway
MVAARRALARLICSPCHIGRVGPRPPTAVAHPFDFETELVIVFGRTCHDVSEDDALAYVAGYAVGDDLSARDLQSATSQFLAGKTPDGFSPVGPWLTTADRIPDPNDLTRSRDSDR